MYVRYRIYWYFLSGVPKAASPTWEGEVRVGRRVEKHPPIVAKERIGSRTCYSEGGIACINFGTRGNTRKRPGEVGTRSGSLTPGSELSKGSRLPHSLWNAFAFQQNVSQIL
jgi:hypothetical protein